jgi:ABC-type sugar transport system ATPase subunit
MAGVTLRKVSKVFGSGERALTEISLEIGDREFVVLVGPSGCGKSTILRIIAGLEDVTSGEVRIGSRRVNDLSPKNRDVAMVFQNYALYPHMTAYDNMAFALKVRRLARAEIDARVRQAASTLGIAPLLTKLPRQLSGGERQRVALGRAIVRKPQVFLFDEPLSNLDAQRRSEMRAEISALHQRLRVTTIYVTHDQVEAMTMGERIVVMKDGIIMQVGAPLEVYRRPANRFVAGFIGSPPMNFLDGALDSDPPRDLRIGGLVLSLPETARHELAQCAQGAVVLGIRPEGLHLTAEHGLPARVTLIEPTGGDCFVHALADGVSLILRVPDPADLRLGEQITVGLDLAAAHFYDPATGNRVASGDRS